MGQPPKEMHVNQFLKKQRVESTTDLLTMSKDSKTITHYECSKKGQKNSSKLRESP